MKTSGKHTNRSRSRPSWLMERPVRLANFVAGASSARCSLPHYDDDDFGVVSLLRQSGARGSTNQLAQLIAPRGAVSDVRRRIAHIRNGWQSGLTPDEVMASVVGARRGLFQMHVELDELLSGQEARERPDGHGVLSRARRAQRPGVVFARAAAAGEVDPLTDEYARLFVGISD